MHNFMEDKEILRRFANKVQHIRQIRGLSQEKLAEKAGLHRTYIGMVERTERNPTLVSIHKIAEGLNVDIKELL